MVIVAVLSVSVLCSSSLFISLLVFNVQSLKVRRACQVYHVERSVS